MAKNSTKIVLTYVITMISAFVIIGGAVIYLITKIENKPNNPAPSETEAVIGSPSQYGYIPEAADNQTLFFIVDTEKRQTASCFLLVRFLATDGKVIIVPVQSDLLCTVDGTQNSLYEFYRTGGSKEAVSAIESAAGITVDRYMKFDRASFEVFADHLGGIDYDVPYNLVYDDKAYGDDTIIKAGMTYLESDTLRKVLTYPNYKGGETERAKALGTTMNSILNGCNSVSTESTLDETFNLIINSSVETDITAYDYSDKKEAIKYVIDPENPQVVQLVLPSGSYNETGLYSFDSNFLKALYVWFGISEISE